MSILPSPVVAQRSAVPSLSVRLSRTAEVHDSIIDYRYSGFSQYVRLTNGAVAIGPLRRGSDTVAMLRLSREFARAPGYVRTGFGPKELSGVYVLAAGPNASTLTASREMARAKWLSEDGSLLRIAPMPEIVDGIGLCGGEIMLSGTEFANRGWQAGVFRAQAGATAAQLVHSLQAGPRLRPSAGYTQMLTVRNDRLIAAIPNRAAVSISDPQCRTFRRLAVALPWFRSWDVASDGVPWSGPKQPTIYAIQWQSDTAAWILSYRANPAAQYFTDAKSTSSPVPPRELTVPLVETVLTLFDTRSGAVMAEATLPRVGWSFLSAAELIRRRPVAESEVMEVYDIDLTRQITKQSRLH